MSTVVPTGLRSASGDPRTDENATIIGRRTAIGILAFAVLPPFAADTLGWVAVAGAVLCSLLANRSRSAKVRISLPVVFFMCWAALSTFWSVDRTPTVTGVGLMILATSVGWLIAVGRDLTDLLAVTAAGFLVVLIGCWITAVVAPGVAYSSDINDAGAMKGLFIQKNAMGYFCALALVTFWTCLVTRSGRRWVWFGASCLALVSIVATQSGTSAVVSAVVWSLGIALTLIARLRRPFGLAFFAILCVVSFAAQTLISNPQVIIGAVGKDATLTGRTEIWEVVRGAIAERPWQGYGWAALWRPGSPTTEELWARGGFQFYHAHNGYLDVAAQLGIIGAVIAFGLILALLLNSTLRYLADPSAATAWPVLIVTLVLIYNATEVVGFKNATWILLVALSAIQQKGALARVSAVRNSRPRA